ncbi:PilZ domain-containing protein [Oceanidesulfovibrio marinus]|uniref:PilZ domain-containing protein n=1 Tax=Oceanidesulfovibrio marinus TaxID=370038 RepID=A0A6P1ZIQ9_9BACT|nr:PilZ domain-containing protein [Oceanidesulfovibrio marinus]TVM35154.1 PilZ domain-containing protein [Oceanidesulfovibrio marinus]
MKEHEEDRRTFSRVSTRIDALIRRIESPDAPQLFHETLLLPDARNIFVGSNVPKEIGEFLLALDAKLDTLVSMASRDRLEQDFPIPADVYEVSGNGIRFHTTHDFRPGDHVEVVLFLSRMPLRLTSAVGVVLDKRAASSRDELSPQWALKFTRIREQDLEAVVQFVFQQERRTIRERRLYHEE